MSVPRRICVRQSNLPYGKYNPNSIFKANGSYYRFTSLDDNGNCCFELTKIGARKKKTVPASTEITCANSFYMVSSATTGFLADTPSLLDSNLAGSNNFSMSFWDLVPQTANPNYSYGRRTGAATQFVVFRTAAGVGATVNIRIYTNNADFTTWTTTNFVPYAQWAHIVITYDASLPLANRVHIYLNGVDEVLTIVSTGAGLSTVASAPTASFRVHRSQGATGFTSLYDLQTNRMMFWDSVISAAEDTTLYNSGNGIDERVDNGAYTSASNLLVWYCPTSATFDTAWRWSSSAGSLGSTQLSSFAMGASDRNDQYPPIL